MIEWTINGSITIDGGTFDANRSGQNFPANTPKEVRLVGDPNSGGDFARIQDSTGFENSDFFFEIRDFDQASVENLTVDSRPELLSDPALGSGLDGLHIYDVRRITVANPQIRSGDDAVAIGVFDTTIEQISIIGGTLSSPIHANEIRIHHEAEATTAGNIGYAFLATNINDCAEHGIRVTDDPGTGNRISDLRISGVIQQCGQSGISVEAKADRVYCDASIQAVDGHGIALHNEGYDARVDALIQNFGSNSNGIFANFYDTIRVEGEIAQGGVGVRAINCYELYVSATIRSLGGRAIWGSDVRHALVTGSMMKGTARPIYSEGTSDYWTIVGNHGRDNATRGMQLAGANNLRANNQFL